MWYKKALAQSSGFRIALQNEPVQTLQDLMQAFPQLAQMNTQQIAEFISKNLDASTSPTDVNKLLQQATNAPDPDNSSTESKLDMGLHQQYEGNTNINPHGVPQDMNPQIIWQGMPQYQTVGARIENPNLPTDKTFVGTTIGSSV